MMSEKLRYDSDYELNGKYFCIFTHIESGIHIFTHIFIHIKSSI